MDYQTLSDDGILAIEYSNQFDVDLPSLTSISTGRCISRYVAGRLVAIDQAAQCLPVNSSFIRLGLAAAVEPLSKIRCDGRALRIVKKPRKLINTVLTDFWEKMARDVQLLSESFPNGSSMPTVHLGDGRDPLAAGIPRRSVDMILTSPPYPNNIDYSEVYKLELWILGFIASKEQFLNLRHSTVRSHPTYDRHSSLNEAFEEEVKSGVLKDLLGPVTKRLDECGEKWRARMGLAYFSDLWEAVGNYEQVLKRNGIAAFVIGNSLHGTSNPAMITSDLILAKIGVGANRSVIAK
jgi:hypothetical protein